VLEDPTVLVVISSVASLLNYVILRYSGFGWPAKLHNEGTISSVIVGATVLSLLDTSRSNYASYATNDTMLVVDCTTKHNTSPITQRQLQAIKYVCRLSWIIQEGRGFNYICVA
jgi:hypothetical protein